jgi:hypothetical protein
LLTFSIILFFLQIFFIEYQSLFLSWKNFTYKC